MHNPTSVQQFIIIATSSSIISPITCTSKLRSGQDTGRACTSTECKYRLEFWSQRNLKNLWVVLILVMSLAFFVTIVVVVSRYYARKHTEQHSSSASEEMFNITIPSIEIRQITDKYGRNIVRIQTNRSLLDDNTIELRESSRGNECYISIESVDQLEK
ncbi:unnamed protein product [Thelazia callipaeda]|uniref:Integral membrane protein n=1 Tax=Thelazia callipaeda TaxID=103827 RepID=A0A0N5DAM6_THECL|nr:unnamed protein product [Thelazia callipaeda]